MDLTNHNALGGVATRWLKRPHGRADPGCKPYHPAHLARVARPALLALGIGITTSAAAQPAPRASTNYPDTLQHMIDAGSLRVLKQFPTSKPDLEGYLVRHRGYTTVVYSNSGYLMFGPLIGPNGQNLSKQYVQKYQPRPKIGRILGHLDPSQIVSQGPADAPTLYVFADPNCIFCHRFYTRVQPLVASGRLQVKSILVGVIKPSSPGRAAAILAADNPAAALERNEAGFKPRREEGGIAPQQPGQHLAAVLTAHRQAMGAIGGTGTPTVIYRNSQGAWAAKVGVPPAIWLQHYAQSPSDHQGSSP